jgi:glycosyltransferase involved in cell wall biosynthesis
LRVRRLGQQLWLGEDVFRVRGVTYGSFRPRRDGHLFPEPQVIRSDLAAIAALGLNTVRIYTAPPTDLLEAAREFDVRLLAGIQYDDWRMHPPEGRRTARAVLRAGRAAVADCMARCAGRPDVLAVSVGNEVPADLVRLHGVETVEDVLAALVAEVHAADAGMLATYSNFPTTEYLHVEGRDLTCFNVFLERPEQLRAYLQHLQRLSSGTPLVMTELGLAAGLHGDMQQAKSLAWQLAAVEEAGCAGATVFAWTDDWSVDGHPVEGWGFGVTDKDRRPKPAAGVLERWTSTDVRASRDTWPAITVVVCAYNEERRLPGCLASLARLDYPALEVIVCDDGSTDGTLEAARRFPFPVLALPHGGLSNARNEGIAAATTDLVAFLDADAEASPDWPYHLALSFDDADVTATGGPNLPFPDVGMPEHAVSLSPGAPTEVLISDVRAEHVPGCNMAFRRDVLVGLGGFRAEYTAAGDDVDVCWRLLDAGYQIGFSPAAYVLHHRRDSLRGYLRQQRGYGRAERMLSGPHRHRFNRLGNARWAGSVYGGPRVLPRLLRPVVYHGAGGSAPFQAVVRHRAAPIMGWISGVLPLLLLSVAVSAAAAPAWPWAGIPGLIGLSLLLSYAAVVAAAAAPPPTVDRPARFRLLVATMYFLQPLVRAWGRVTSRPLPLSQKEEHRHEWIGDREVWLRDLSRDLLRRRCTVAMSTEHDRWDFEVRVGPLIGCRIRTAVRWSWLPDARRSWRPARTSAWAVAIVGASAVAAPVIGMWLAVVLAVAAVGEAVLLRHRINGALRATTARAMAE